MRPEVCYDTKERLIKAAREVDDGVPTDRDPTVEECLRAVLDHLEESQDGEDGEWEEVIGEDTQGVGQLPGRSSGGRF